jgi:hypothetical protein
MLLYSNFINNITEEEIEKMNEEDIYRYYNSKDFCAARDKAFAERLMVAANEYTKNK